MVLLKRVGAPGVLLGMMAAISTATRSQELPRLERTAGVRPFVNSSFALAVAEDGRQYAIAGRKGIVVVYDATDHAEQYRVEHDAMVLAVAYSKPENCLLTLGDPQRLRVISRDDGRVLREVELPYRCGFVATHPVLPLVALCGRTPVPAENASPQQVIFVNIRTGRIIGGLQGDFQRGFHLAFSADGQTLYLLANVGRPPTQRFALLKVPTTGLTDLAFVAERPSYRPIYETDVFLSNLAIAPDGKHLAVTDQTGATHLFELPRGIEAYTWRDRSGDGNVLTFWDDHHLIASGGNHWRFYRVDQLEPQHEYPDADSSSANHLVRLPRTDVAVSSHARANNQLVRWRLHGLPRVDPGGSGSGRLASSLADSSRPSNELSRPPMRERASPRATPMADPSGAPAESPRRAPKSSGRMEDSQFRIWTHAASGRRLKAMALGRDGDELLLVQEDGAEFVVPVSSLAIGDQSYCATRFGAPWREKEAPFPKLLDTPATMALLPKLPIAAADAAWLAEMLGAPMPVAQLQVRISAPNGRGGSWLATDIGLAEHDAITGQVRVRALVPDLSGLESKPLRPGISQMVVDRFGRPIVHWDQSGCTFRWNGVRWTYLTVPRGALVHSIAAAGKELWAVLSANRGGEGPTSLARLEESVWTPWSVRLDKMPLDNVEQLFGSTMGHLVGVRRNSRPVRITGNVATEFEATELDAFHLAFNSSGNWMPRAAIDPNGRVLFLRMDRNKVNMELIAVGQEQQPLEARFPEIDDPVVLGVAVDAGGRMWLQVTPSPSERARKIIESGRRLPSNAGVFVQEGQRWLRFSDKIADTLSVTADRQTDRSSGMHWSADRSLAMFLASRVWKTSDGKHSLQAELVDFDEASVRLRGPEGVITIERSLLDGVDQKFLDRLQRYRTSKSWSPPSIRRILRKRTAGDSFFNEDWPAMLEAGLIFPGITQAAGPQEHSSPLDHLWVIVSGGNVAKWEGDRLVRAPVLQTKPTVEPQTPKQLIVANQGKVFICCADGQVRMLAGDRWELLNQGVTDNLVVRRLRVVHDRLLAVVGSASPLQRAGGAPPSSLSGVLQWDQNHWRPVILLDASEAGSALDVAALPKPSETAQTPAPESIAVSWSRKRFTVCELDRLNTISVGQFRQLPEAPSAVARFVVSDGVLFGAIESGILQCLWDERTRSFIWSETTSWPISRVGAAHPLQADASDTIWHWMGRPTCWSGTSAPQDLSTEGERPLQMQLVGERYLIMSGSHLSLYEIQR